MPYLLALDQGTTSSRAILFDTEAPARWERTYASLGLSALGAIAMRTVGEA